MSFSDGNVEILLEAESNGVLWVSEKPLSFHGTWDARGKRAPKLAGKLGNADGPEVATGPNGALRVSCGGKMRQFFRGPDRQMSLLPALANAPISAGETCRLLGF